MLSLRAISSRSCEASRSVASSSCVRELICRAFLYALLFGNLRGVLRRGRKGAEQQQQGKDSGKASHRFLFCGFRVSVAFSASLALRARSRRGSISSSEYPFSRARRQ